MPKTIPLRAQVPVEDTWNLTAIFPSDEAWKAAYDELAAAPEDLLRFQGTLGQSGANLLAFLRYTDGIGDKLGKLGAYARRKADEDTRNTTYQDMSGKFMFLAVKISEAGAFSTPELLAVADETLADFYQTTPDLAHYRLFIDRIRKEKAHTLSPEGEALLAAAAQLGASPEDVFSMLSDADLTFPDALDSKSVAHPVTHGTFVPLLQSADRVLRESAFKSLYGVYETFKNTFAATLSAQIKQVHFFASSRKYPSSLHAALSGTEVDPKIYHNLIAAVRNGLPAMHRYVHLRKSLLGVEKLHFYDLYTPIVPDADGKVTYEEAKALALDALHPLGEQYQSLLREGFANRWIDVYENQGKRSGAYSAGTYGIHPYVLLNYTDTLNDAFTLVHEMGHALHSYLSNQTQSITYADYTIFVAEVASTCNEALLMQHLLGKTTDKRRRAYLINYFLEQFRGTIYRQTMFAEFELWCNEQVQAGVSLTAQTLSDKYRQLNLDYYGEEIELDPEIALEWARIPHFYYNFYVYQYATGFAAAIAISQRILREGQPAVDDYLGFLSGGCSADPVTLLRGAGVDMSSPAPVEQALQLFDELTQELKQLMA